MIRIDYIDDETLEVYFNDEHIVSANHDEDGWAGMAKIRNAFVDLATFAGWEVKVNGITNV